MPLIALVKIAARIVGAAFSSRPGQAGRARALGLSGDPTARSPLALIASAPGRMAGQQSRRLMNSRSTANKAEVVSIQYLRGVAAMSVALFHTSVNMPAFAWPSSLARDFGDCGIDVFFVISGFVMFFVTKDNSMSSQTFLLRRIIRIVPLYWLATILYLVLFLASGYGRASEVVLSHIVQSMLFIPHVNPGTGTNVPLLRPGYTLNYEMYFYFLFAALLLVASAGKRVVLLVAYGIAVSLLFVVTDPQAPALRIYENPIILEFVAGSVLGYLYVNGYLAKVSPWIGLSMVVLGAAGLPYFHLKNSDFETFTQGGPAALLVCGALILEAANRLPKIEFMKTLGDSSYSIYLVNPIILSALNGAMRFSRVPVENPLVGTPLVLLGLGAAALGGYVTYRFIELPLTGWCKRSIFRGKPASASRREVLTPLAGARSRG
jgi:peptidoglycan/LPS O-acetylase OafA/YrhL